MSKINELIEEFCPEGVAYIPLPDVADIVRGLTYSKTDEDPEGPVRVLRSNNINQSSNILNLVDVKRLRKELAPSQRTRIQIDDVLMSAASGSRSHVGKVAYIDKDPEAYFGGFMTTFRATSRVLPRFIFHVLTSTSFRDHLDLVLSTSTINNINASVLAGYGFPLPPLEVQREIVSILDKFTQLEAELEAELEARRDQFQYFCDRAYAVDGSQSPAHQISTLGEQGSLTKGSGLQKIDFRDQGEPCIHYGQIHSKFGSVVDKNLTFIDKALFSKLRKATYGNLVIADTAEDFAGVARGIAWIGAHEVAVGGHALIYDHGFDPIYISYFLRSHAFQVQKNQLAKGVKVKDISGKALGKIAVPVPNIEKQRSIGRQLANLDNLAKDASIGLPAEITARREQYEYYRNKLLTFKALENA